ncbi:uncharacterized protein LOC123921209 isoform X5 [Trifolium pratense]|uniref:uncharacterized protein LOC123921209 isoform X5 n=1 Tax=Trifolium pratense TaxID=57577 RepID=UPI001E693868|nr:uncharacterized protein LOC123921209 isoform X5 [Trifolium pratense]
MLFFLSVFFHIQICLCFAARKMVKTHDHNLSNGKRFTNPATTKIDEDLELRYPHKGMFKELLKKQGSQNYGLIVIQFYQKTWVCFDYQKMEYSVSEINYQRLLFMNLKKKKKVIWRGTGLVVQQ